MSKTSLTASIQVQTPLLAPITVSFSDNEGNLQNVEISLNTTTKTVVQLANFSLTTKMLTVETTMGDRGFQHVFRLSTQVDTFKFLLDQEAVVYLDPSDGKLAKAVKDRSLL